MDEMAQVLDSSVDCSDVLATCDELLVAGSYEQALDHLTQLLQEQPLLPRALHMRGRIQMAQKQLPEAIQSFIEATEAAPDDPVICFDLAKAVGMVGWHEHSLAVARRVVELDHEHHEAFLLIADAQEALGQREDAIEALRRAVFLLKREEPEPEDLLESPRPVPYPATPELHFSEFSGSGDVTSFQLVGKSPDGKHQMVVAITRYAGATSNEAGEVVGRGEIDRSRLLMSLEDRVRAQVELFPGARFSYSLHKLT